MSSPKNNDEANELNKKIYEFVGKKVEPLLKLLKRTGVPTQVIAKEMGLHPKSLYTMYPHIFGEGIYKTDPEVKKVFHRIYNWGK